MKALGSNGCRNFYQQTTVSFWVFSWLGNCKHNLWQASCLLCSRHRNRPCLPASTRKRQMVGELALTTQWCRGHGMKACLADLIQPTEEVTGKPTRHKRLSTIRGCFLHTALLCSHFFNGRQWYFFQSSMWLSHTVPTVWSISQENLTQELLWYWPQARFTAKKQNKKSPKDKFVQAVLPIPN